MQKTGKGWKSLLIKGYKFSLPLKFFLYSGVLIASHLIKYELVNTKVVK